MATLSEAATRLAAIEEAIASGATRVSYDGKSVEYRSLADMIVIRDGLRRELGIVLPSRRTVARYSSGF